MLCLVLPLEFLTILLGFDNLLDFTNQVTCAIIDPWDQGYYGMDFFDAYLLKVFSFRELD